MCRLLHTVPCLRFSFLLATLQNGESPQAHAAIISPWSPYCIFQSVKAVFQKSVLYAFSTRSTVQPRCMTSCAIQERGSLAAALDRALLPPPSAISPPPPPPHTLFPALSLDCYFCHPLQSEFGCFFAWEPISLCRLSGWLF